MHMPVLPHPKRLTTVAAAWHARLSSQEQIFFAQRLAFLVEGGVPLMDALGVMRGQVRSRSCRRVIEALRSEIAAGHPLADGMRAFPGAFGASAVTLVSIGESCGLLGRNLQHLADELKKQQQLRRKIIGALTYPAVVLAAAFGIVVFLTASLLPKLLPMFLSLHVRLPASTRALLAASAFVRSSGLWVLMGLAGAGVVLASCIRRSTRVLRWCEYAFLRVPAFGSLLRHASVAHFSRAVGTLLTSGLTLREACIACATVNGRGLYDLHFLTMAETVNRGNQLSTHLLRHPRLFPELFGQMIAAGEQSGKLPEAFLYLSDHYEREIDEAANGLSALLEPALMLFTGALVGFIAIAVISPMYAITQSLHA